MLTALIDRLTGLLRPTRPEYNGRDGNGYQPLPQRALVSPITNGLLEAMGIRHVNAVSWLPHLAQAAHRYHIDSTPRRVAAWLATVAHESARLTRLVEDLDYTMTGLAQTWPGRYAERDTQGNYVRIYVGGRMLLKPNALARRIAGRPEQIANLTYAARLGNGSAGTGDGWNYRGRGLIQTTGRANYAASGAALGLDLVAHPELLEQPHYAAISAAEWWHRHGCNAIADSGDLEAVTRRVNGGITGLDDRRRLYSAALAYLGGNAIPQPRTERRA